MTEPFLQGRLHLSLIVPHQLPLWLAHTRGRTLAAIRHIFWCQISSTHSCRRGGGRSGGGGEGGRRQRGGGGVGVDESKQDRAWSWHVAFLKVLFSGRVFLMLSTRFFFFFCLLSSSLLFYPHLLSTLDGCWLSDHFAWPCDVGRLQWLAVRSRFLGDETKETEPRHADAVWDI